MVAPPLGSARNAAHATRVGVNRPVVDPTAMPAAVEELFRQ